jgi:hypothetical protein
MSHIDRYRRAVVGQGLYIPACDAVTVEATSATVETIRHFRNGTSGTNVCTLVLTYVDASKEMLVSAVCTYGTGAFEGF